MNLTSALHGLWRMNFTWPSYFSSGKPGCCRVWYCQTPWGAWNGARRLHASRRPYLRNTPPIVTPAEIEAFRESWQAFMATQQYKTGARDGVTTCTHGVPSPCGICGEFQAGRARTSWATFGGLDTSPPLEEPK